MNAAQPPSAYTAANFRRDLGAGLFGFLYLARYVRIILALWVVLGIGYRVFGSSEGPIWRDIIGLPLLILLGYALAGLCVALGLFTLRPLRRWLFGWIVTGYVLTFAVYGSVGFVAAIGYVWFGINLMDFQDATDAWQSLWSISLLLGLLGIPLAIWLYAKRDRP